LKHPEILPGAEILSISPGRVNLLGEHVDYNGGIVLPMAIDRYVQVAAKRMEDPIFSIHAVDLNQTIEFDLSSIEKKNDLTGRNLPPWALYPAGVARCLHRHGLDVVGMRAAFTSSVPMGAGLSSSAAVEVAFAGAWQILAGWSLDRMTLAKLCQKAENEMVGVESGLMDQFSSANGVDGHVLIFNTRNNAWRTLPLPMGSVVVVADSGIRRSLTHSEYNLRRFECERSLNLLKKKFPTIQYLSDVPRGDFLHCRNLLPEPLFKRTRHVVEECQRVVRAVEALEKADPEAFGRLMFEGHDSLRDLYEVSTPELDALVDVASGQQGCYGARLTGAGFGGCTVNLVDKEWAPSFISNVKMGYLKKTGRQAEIYLCHASRGLNAVKI
jgi:galactokinase